MSAHVCEHVVVDSSPDGTLDQTFPGIEVSEAPDERYAPCLILLLECDRPTMPSVRHALDGVDEVVLGRGQARSVERWHRSLELRVPDERVSRRHARLVRELGRWVVEDLGSRNGTLVGGEPRKRLVLEDGMTFELGHTLWMYREQLASGFTRDDDGRVSPLPGLVSFAPLLRQRLADLARVASTEVPILVQGESGTGKERVARAIHGLSQRGGPLVAVNCGALPGQLVESELFGYRRGAFSGAAEDRTGLVRSAHRGTLFLDEIADLSPGSQAALLRVLQEREVTPIGATRALPVDVRLVAATHHELAEQVAAGRFRHDLYARVAGFTVSLPPLRERREDMGLLVSALLRPLAARSAGSIALAVDAARALLAHDWPLNVRELEHALASAAALAEYGRIRPRHLPRALHSVRTAGAALSASDRERRDELLAVLDRNGGNVSAAAREMRKSRVQVHRWIKRFRIDPRDLRTV